MKLRSLLVAFILPLTFCSAQTCKDEFKANPYLAGSGYVAYPGPKGSLTPAPADYEPCYLSHYGRHGSRYLIGDTYDKVYAELQRAANANMLTDEGKEFFENIKKIREEAAGRDGELTELGAQQHRQIAERMFNNFPEIFKKPKTHIDAKSTVVIRCILSMGSELQQLRSMNPALDIRQDASYHDMYYMNQDDPIIAEAKKNGNKLLDGFRKDHIHPQRLMQEIFSDDSFWKDSIDANRTMQNFFKIAMGLQDTELRNSINLTTLFTADEIYDLWQCSNAYWYVAYGPSRYSDGVQPYSQRNLLRQIITEADSCLRYDNCGANLRFGHDTMVMPLTCLLELDNTAQDIADINTLPTHEWCDYRIFPMACNIQFVFYRSKDSRAATSTRDSKGRPILVKVMLNENEARLPIKTDTYPYYNWQDVKDYYLKKLDAYDATHPTVASSKWDKYRRK